MQAVIAMNKIAHLRAIRGTATRWTWRIFISC